MASRSSFSRRAQRTLWLPLAGLAVEHLAAEEPGAGGDQRQSYKRVNIGLGFDRLHLNDNVAPYLRHV